MSRVVCRRSSAPVVDGRATAVAGRRRRARDVMGGVLRFTAAGVKRTPGR
jgi:hypothetical protein